MVAKQAAIAVGRKARLPNS